MFLQPEELRRLHLRRDDAADIAQHLIAGLVDALRLRVARWSIQTMTLRCGIAGAADRERLVRRRRARPASRWHRSRCRRSRMPAAPLASAIASRIAVAQAFQMSSEDCSTMSPASCQMLRSDGAPSPAACRARSKMPARALAVPTSTPMKLPAACVSLSPSRRAAEAQSTSRYSRRQPARCCRSSGWPRRRRGTARRRRFPRPRRGAPSASRRSRPRTCPAWISRRR